MYRIDRRVASLALAGAVIATALHTSPAAAHVDSSAGGLADALAHPFLGLDHVVAMIAVGALGVLLRRPLLAPATFVLTMAAASALAMAGLPLPFAETAVALSVAALGAALAAGLREPRAALWLVALGGVAHGHVHGLEAPAGTHPAVYIVGFVLATATLHAAGAFVGARVRGHRARHASLGALVFGVGLGLLAGL